MSNAIKSISIEGYKSIRKLENFELRPLNVLIGANGAGKSNFVSFFGMLKEIVEQRLQLAVQRAGGADMLLHLGPKFTNEVSAKISYDSGFYEVALEPTNDGRLVFNWEYAEYCAPPESPYPEAMGSRHQESRFRDYIDPSGRGCHAGQTYHVYESISSFVIYHFNDTSDLAGMRRQKPINDDEHLREDAENLAAFLFKLRTTAPVVCNQIRDVVRLAAPFFDDFKLRPVTANPDLIQLEWTQVGSDYPFRPGQLSDGTLRFICLATALLQPHPPATMLFDEPELGLHPYALTLLASLFKQAEKSGRQVIVCTQSAALLNEFEPEDVIVVDRQDGQSTFRRLEKDQLSEWLENYGLGELWQKNIFGGRPHNETGNEPPGGDPQ